MAKSPDFFSCLGKGVKCDVETSVLGFMFCIGEPYLLFSRSFNSFF